MKRETMALFERLEMTPKEVSRYLGNKSHFTTEMLEEYEKQVRLLDEQLSRMRSQVRNPKKIKKSFDALRLANNWIRVN